MNASNEGCGKNNNASLIASHQRPVLLGVPGFHCLQEVRIKGFKKLFPSSSPVATSGPALPASTSHSFMVQSSTKEEGGRSKVDCQSPEALVLLFRKYLRCDGVASSMLMLDFTGCWDLSDRLLYELLENHSRMIRSLNLTACFQLTDDGLKSIFSLDLPNLACLNLASCGALTSATLKYILKKVGSSVTELVLADCVLLTEEVTFHIRAEVPGLKRLDLSGIKAINDVSMAYLNGVRGDIIQEGDDNEGEQGEDRANEVKNAMHFYPPRRYYIDDDDDNINSSDRDGNSTTTVNTLQEFLSLPLSLECLNIEGCVNISLASVQQVVDTHRASLRKLDMRHCCLATMSAASITSTLSSPL